MSLLSHSSLSLSWRHHTRTQLICKVQRAVTPSAAAWKGASQLCQIYASYRSVEDRLREYLRGEVDADAEEADPDIYEREKTLALIQTLENKLESVEQALRLVEKGTYGICERCGEKIGRARLEALPYATLCVKCKSQMERVARTGVRFGGR